jgi:predicted AlkP superfamily phosphohydrolase/phosphomutase
VVVGLDGADWQLLDDYVKAGAMPQLARLAAEGRRGVLVTQHPPLSPLVWTTMMTGRGPLEHHILDFTRRAPGTGAREPITSDERRVPALWNMADQRGRRSAVLGMWATYPAETIRGVVVSDRLFSFQQGASTEAASCPRPIARAGRGRRWRNRRRRPDTRPCAPWSPRSIRPNTTA